MIRKNCHIKRATNINVETLIVLREDTLSTIKWSLTKIIINNPKPKDVIQFKFNVEDVF
jgi:hypothetical protein